METILNTPLRFDRWEVPNRVVLQPMEGCDCGEDGSPGELTREKYLRAARSGAGIIWMEACAVCPEGRTNPGQLMLTEKNLPQFKALLTDMRQASRAAWGGSPLLLCQLTHSGRQSITPMIAYRHPIYEETRPVADENIVTDEYLDILPGKYAASARLAVEAGFDGVDVKSCHGYLFQEVLSAFTRPGRYGGSLENRTRLFLDSIRAVKAAVPGDFLVCSRLSVVDMVPKPYGFGTTEENEVDLAEPDLLIQKLVELGIPMLNVTLGNPYYNPHVNRPFRKGPYEAPESPDAGLARFWEIEQHIKEKFPTLTVVGSGLSYYRAELMEKAEAMVAEKVCDLVGFGRMWLAYPTFFRDYLAGEFAVNKCCVACSRCTELMRHHCVSGCAVFNPTYKKLYEERVACKK